MHELGNMPEKLKAEGYTEDQIARAIYEKRRELGRQCKEAAPPLFREYIYAATAAKYWRSAWPDIRDDERKEDV